MAALVITAGNNAASVAKGEKVGGAAIALNKLGGRAVSCCDGAGSYEAGGGAKKEKTGDSGELHLLRFITVFCMYALNDRVDECGMIELVRNKRMGEETGLYTVQSCALLAA